MSICFAYFDVSGHPAERKHREFTVGGFVGLEKKWDWFDAKWEAVLKEYGVESFEASKMAHWSKPYDTWVVADGRRDDAKRAKYIQELTRVIKGTVYKAFSHSVSLDHYDAVNADYRLDELCKPFGLCAAQIMRDVAVWKKRAHPVDDVLFIFDNGDCDKGDLEKTLQRRRLRPPHPPQFMPKRWKDAAGKASYHRPFEACDLWAYEDGLAFRLVNTGKQTRRSHQYLNRQIPSVSSPTARRACVSSARSWVCRGAVESVRGHFTKRASWDHLELSVKPQPLCQLVPERLRRERATRMA